MTFCSHTFADLRKVRSSSCGTVIVEIAQMISKGSRLVELIVSLEGDPSAPRDIDFIVQFSHYLKRSFGLTLDCNMASNEAFLSLATNSTPLWGYSTREAWALRLNTRFVMAGYPDSYFTPHSPRH